MIDETRDHKPDIIPASIKSDNGEVAENKKADSIYQLENLSQGDSQLTRVLVR